MDQVDEQLRELMQSSCVVFLGAKKEDGDIDPNVMQIGSDLYAVVMVFLDDEGHSHSRWHVQLHQHMDMEGMKVLLQGVASLGHAVLQAALNMAGQDWEKLWNMLSWNRAN